MSAGLHNIHYSAQADLAGGLVGQAGGGVGWEFYSRMNSPERKSLHPLPESERALRRECRRIFLNAVVGKRIPVRNRCESCGFRQVRRKPRHGMQGVEAHHWDYTKPLEVVWLCHWCHMWADDLLRAELRSKWASEAGRPWPTTLPLQLVSQWHGGRPVQRHRFPQLNRMVGPVAAYLRGERVK